MAGNWRQMIHITAQHDFSFSDKGRLPEGK
jgi:hypothetical protein